MSASKWKPYEHYNVLESAYWGGIPSKWNKDILGRIVEINGRIGWRGLRSDDYRDDGPILLAVGNIGHWGNLITENTTKISREAFNNSPEIVVKNNDLLISKSGTIGRTCVIEEINEDMTINAAINILRCSEKIKPQFLHYWIQSSAMQTETSLLSFANAQGNLFQRDMRNLLVFLPSISEQEKIIQFCVDSEKTLRKVEKNIEFQISSIEEKRSAIITQAVTKGLNPNVPMKDSGIDWYGKIPEHWSLLKMNYVVNDITDIDHYMPKSVNEGIPYLMTGDLKDRVSEINFQNCKQVSNLDFQNLSKKVRTSKGDVILARYATIGTASYVDIENDFLVSYSCVTVKPDIAKMNGLFLYYFFKSDAFRGSAQYYTNTGTQGNVGVGDLKKIKMILPTLEEQTEIVKYINLHMSILDKLFDSLKQNLLNLKEYRTALISAAVTGKIDVRSL